MAHCKFISFSQEASRQVRISLSGPSFSIRTRLVPLLTAQNSAYTLSLGEIANCEEGVARLLLEGALSPRHPCSGTLSGGFSKKN